MGLFDGETIYLHNQQERPISPAAKSNSDIIINQLKTLSVHPKLVLYACISLLFQDNNAKVTMMDVFERYKKLATESNINWLSLSKVIEYIKELEMLGFLRCTYPPKGHRQIKYIHIFEPAEIPKYIAVLQEDLRKDNMIQRENDRL